MTPTKNSNRPIFDSAKGIATLDARNTAARFVLFAALEKAGASKESLSAKGAHFAEFKSGVLAGWQGAAFAKKFDKTKEGKVILSGKVIDRFGGSEVISKTKTEWAKNLSAKMDKLRTAYCEWLADGVVPDAPAGADETAETAETAKPAAKRKSGARKPLPDRIKSDVAALHAALVRDIKATPPQLTVDANRELRMTFDQILKPKKLPARILNDVESVQIAINHDAKSETPQLTPELQSELQAAFTRIVDLLK